METGCPLLGVGVLDSTGSAARTPMEPTARLDKMTADSLLFIVGRDGKLWGLKSWTSGMHDEMMESGSMAQEV
jgi:hypothetical protein